MAARRPFWKWLDLCSQTWLMLRKPCQLQTDGRRDGRTDRRTDGQGESSIPLTNFVGRGYNKCHTPLNNYCHRKGDSFWIHIKEANSYLLNVSSNENNKNALKWISINHEKVMINLYIEIGDSWIFFFLYRLWHLLSKTGVFNIECHLQKGWHSL